MRYLLILSLAIVAIGGYSTAEMPPCEVQARSITLTPAKPAPIHASTCRLADLVRSDLIVAPESCDPGGTFLISIPAGLEYTIEPKPKVAIPLRDETGNRVLVVQSAESPGYTISVDSVTIHPTPEELKAAPDFTSREQLVKWLADHSRDEIYSDSHTVKVGEPEPPGPDPDPDEPDGDAPIPEPGFRVLIKYEQSEKSKLPIEQQLILTGSDVREFLIANCVKVDGNPQFRIFDKDVPTEDDLEVWQKAMARPHKSIPWVVISNGKTGFEGPLPAGPTAFLDLARKYLPK